MSKFIVIHSARLRKPKNKHYDKKSLAIGTKIEMEHTPDKKMAAIVAKNHLDEDKNYYKKLKKVEK